MSSSLYWTPPPKQVKEHGIDYIKYEIGKYFDEDYAGGSAGEWVAEKHSDIIPFLKGIASVGTREQVDDANELIDAINTYGKVILVIH